MKKGLYVLFEGLPTTVIDSQVLLHARAMREQEIIDFEVWSFAPTTALFNRSLARLPEAQRLSQSPIRVFRGIRPALPFSGPLNAFLLFLNVRKFKPDFTLIHARTDYSAAVCGYLRLLRRFNLVWDCRADAEAEVRARFLGGSLLRRLILWYQVLVTRWRVLWSARMCHSAIFVTGHLKRVKGQGIKDKPFQIIPSVTSTDLFYFDPALRAQTRQQLGYAETNTVLVYSGSLAHYQCFPEAVSLFRRLHERDSGARLLVLTPQTSDAAEMLADLPQGSWQVIAGELDQMNSYLNAADYALMLRRHDPLNTAAFPTKFAEYGLAGLPVIMSDSVPEAYDHARQAGNLCEYLDGEVILNVSVDRKSVSRHYQSFLARDVVFAKYKMLYSMAGE